MQQLQQMQGMMANMMTAQMNQFQQMQGMMASMMAASMTIRPTPADLGLQSVFRPQRPSPPPPGN